MYTIIPSTSDEKIECSALVKEKKLKVVPKKIFVCNCYFLISVWNGGGKRLIGKIFIMK